MIKFIHKKQVRREGEKGKIIIYYSFTDIFLGLVLFALVLFFIRDYLSHSLNKQQDNCLAYSNSFLNLNKIDMQKKINKN
ncbi:MAG: hypothetical protein WCG45_01720 [bacterium]